MLIYFHNDNLTRSAKNQKTYGRFFGMIFLGASASTLMIVPQWLPKNKTSKKRKNENKMVNNLRRTPIFLPKWPKNDPIFMSVLR
jgi:hypothetical protein